METTVEHARDLILERLEQYPEIITLISDPNFRRELSKILTFHKLDVSYLTDIENEIVFVLSFCSPLSELSLNIAEKTGLSLELCEEITTMIESVLLPAIMDDLVVIDHLWDEDFAKEKNLPEANTGLKERLELRPEGFAEDVDREDPKEELVKPLTREELLSALSAKRTMASDIEAVRQKGGTNRAE